jgi:hypothetical protein
MRPIPIPLQRMVKFATLIAVTQVEKIEVVEGIRVARVVVLRSFKGGLPGQRFRYIAEPTWMCDISMALPNETALLFLFPAETGHLFYETGKSKQAQYTRALKSGLRGVSLYQIVSNGGGRMPIRTWNGREHILRQRTAVLPPKVSVTRDPTRPKEDVRYSPLDEVIPYIRKYLAQQSVLRPG